MNDLVQLINAFAAFKGNHPEADIEDFCRYYLIQRREGDLDTAQANEAPSSQSNGQLLRLISRLMAILGIYSRIALGSTRLKHFDSFPFLNALHEGGEMRKSDVINGLLVEISTGTDILNRLIWDGLAAERTDPGDRRSKLVSITSKGETLLQECYDPILQVGETLFGDMAENDKKLIIQLLTRVEQKHSILALKAKR
jgi:DNA-binding MarR family transcriptional regulator